MTKKSAIVMGGGIQGCCVSLALLREGYTVTLMDQATEFLDRASLNQEGKIHLGFVYGLDRSGETGLRLLHDGLRFAPEMEALLEARIDWASMASRPFLYLVPRDSMLDRNEVGAFFEQLASAYREEMKDPRLHYLGKRDEAFFRSVPLPAEVAHDAFQAAFTTMEIAIDQLSLKTKLLEALSGHGDFTAAPEEEIISITQKGTDTLVQSRHKHKEDRKRTADVVVNCLWESRDRMDAALGLVNSGTGAPNLRLKIGLLVEPDPALNNLDSLTMVHGAYGDFVQPTLPGRAQYFCWYPVSMRGMVCDWKTPESWSEALKGRFSEDFQQELGAQNFEAFRQLLPGIHPFRIRSLRAGVIVARGEQDIIHRRSGLHNRKEPPLRNRGNYWSIGTGKYTSAPANTRLFINALQNR